MSSNSVWDALFLKMQAFLRILWDVALKSPFPTILNQLAAGKYNFAKQNITCRRANITLVSLGRRLKVAVPYDFKSICRRQIYLCKANYHLPQANITLQSKISFAAGKYNSFFIPYRRLHRHFPRRWKQEVNL